MWDLRKNLTHGRLSVRRISVLATALMMVFFVGTLALTRTALAADATRVGDTLTYDNHQYKEITNPSSTLPKNLPANTSGYYYVDAANNKTYFILTAGAPGQATQGQYVYYDGIPTDNYSNPSPPKTVSIADGDPNSLENAGAANSACDSSLTGGIGWILCPVVNFMASGMDHLYEILSAFLEVRPIQSDTTSSLYRMWAIVRDIANICFVIAFLFIVYSQVTSFGISNYNVKRMLPRLMVAAILVNLSFWISALAVDLSNFLGHAIHDLFMSIFRSLNSSGQYKDLDITTLSWESLSTAILSGGTIVGVGLWANFVVLGTGLPGALILLIPILVGVLFAVMVAILVMAARQALITCLVIISPLAFVAYLLPNTEKYFDKWKDLFMTMLLLYPIFSVIFGASQLAGLAIIQNANSLNLIILGMAVMVAPVVVTPLLVKFSGSFVGRLANMVNNPRRGVMDRTRNWAQGRAQEEKAKILAGQSRNNWANRRTVAIDRKRRRKDGWKKAYETMADNNFAATGEGQALEAASRRSANDKVRIDNAFARTAVGRQIEYQSRLYNVDKQRVENEFEDSHEGHAVSRARRITEMDKHRIESNHEETWNREVRTNPELFQRTLDVQAAEVRGKIEKGKVDKLQAEVAAQGKDNEYILNLRGVDARTQAGMLNIAHDIQRGSNEVTYTTMATDMANRKAKEIVAKELSDVSQGRQTIQVDGVDIHKYAAGIKGHSGEQAILSRAKSENSSVLMDDIKNIKNTLNYVESTNTDILLNKFKAADATLEERVAYATIMTERGGPGNVSLRKAIDFIDQNYSAQDPDVQDFKELVAGMSGAMKSGKDIEFWLTNSADSSGAPRTLANLANDPKTWNALQVESFVGQNMISQLKALRTYARTNPDLYNKLVHDIKANPMSYAGLKPAVKDAMEYAPDATDPSNPSRLFWSDEAIRERARLSPADYDFNNPW